MKAVIMAGGFGTRLYPLTHDVPKPMLPVGDQPLLQRIVVRLRECGVHHIFISTFHAAEKIMEYFGDGSEFGVKIDYLVEDEPLGTAGALSLLEYPEERVLVLNGDVLTTIDFQEMAEFHQKKGAAMTIAVHPHRVQIPYGVIEGDGKTVSGIREKPTYTCMVNAGIYIIEPQVRASIKRGRRLMMSDLINTVIESGRPVAPFAFDEYWLDIGQHEQYRQAQSDVRELPQPSGKAAKKETPFTNGLS